MHHNLGLRLGDVEQITQNNNIQENSLKSQLYNSNLNNQNLTSKSIKPI